MEQAQQQPQAQQQQQPQAQQQPQPQEVEVLRVPCKCRTTVRITVIEETPYGFSVNWCEKCHPSTELTKH